MYLKEVRKQNRVKVKENKLNPLPKDFCNQKSIYFVILFVNQNILFSHSKNNSKG